jgi:hypothetical protein
MNILEIPCNDCNFSFSDKITFNIHLKSCKDNINYDPKNKYYCPVCSRQFRVLSNLHRHEETKKHQDLLNWEKKQLSDTLFKNLNNNKDSNIKTINLTVSIEKKVTNCIDDYNKMELEINNSIKENTDIFNNQPDELNFSDFINEPENKDESNIIDFNTTLPTETYNNDNSFTQNDNYSDPFLIEIGKTFETVSDVNNYEIIQNNTPRNDVLQNNTPRNDVLQNNTPRNDVLQNNTPRNDSNNSNDSFIDKLVKEREKMLSSFIKLPATKLEYESDQSQKKSELHSSLSFSLDPILINTVSNNKSEYNILDDKNIQYNSESIPSLQSLIDEDDIDLSEELKKTQQNLAFFSDYRKKELETKIYDNDVVLNNIQSVRTVENTSDNNIKTVSFKNPIEKSITISKTNDIDKKSNTKIINNITPIPTPTPTSNQKVVSKYPEQFKQKPIWKELTKIINEKDCLKKLVNIFTNQPFNDYIVICTFIIFSGELDNKLNIKLSLISSIIEMNKFFIKLSQNRQFIWNGKNIIDCINLFNKLKLNDQFTKCKNDIDNTK